MIGVGLGAELLQMMDAIRDRVEVAERDDTWLVTAGSFDTALDYVNARFEDPLVLSRRDHGRRWTRVTLEVTTDPTLAPDAPSLTDLAETTPPVSAVAPPVRESSLPPVLEEIFARQDQR